MAIRQWFLNRRFDNHETGSDADGSWGSEDVDRGPRGGHPIPAQTVATPFYGVNPARNNGQDLEPIPITPVRGQNWPEMQIQLRQGWAYTNYGKKLSYDDYLRLLNEAHPNKAHAGSAQFVNKGPNWRIGPAPGNVNSMVSQTSGSQPNTPGGPGFLAADVNLAGRGYYG